VNKTLDDVVGELDLIRKSVDEIRLGQAAMVQAVQQLVTQVSTSKAVEQRLAKLEAAASRAGWTLQ
jgi:hypothetical protein